MSVNAMPRKKDLNVTGMPLVKKAAYKQSDASM